MLSAPLACAAESYDKIGPLHGLHQLNLTQKGAGKPEGFVTEQSITQVPVRKGQQD